MQSPKTLQQAIQHFTDYENCRRFMVSVRWLDGIVRCPRCGSDKVAYLSNARLYKCNAKHEKQKFSLKVGTVMEDSALPLEKWLPAIWLVASCKNGISSWELHRSLGVTQKSAWFMLHRIRLALRTNSLFKIGSPEGGEVEVDETFIGGKTINMHKKRRAEMQKKHMEMRGSDAVHRYVNKTAVQGMLDRDLRQVRAKVVPNVRRDTLQNEVLNHVRFGSRLYTDNAVSYELLNSDYVHEVVSHADEYVRGRIHTNGLENFWSLLKRTLRGTYVAVEPFHLDRYLDEQAFRFNNRATKDNPLDDSDRFVLALSQIVNKRLTYAELTGKVGETAF
jgi:transposase-like protein